VNVPDGSIVIAQFWVAGKPQTGGSKKAFVNKKTGRAIVTEDNKKSKPWRADVQAAAYRAVQLESLLEGPLVLKVTFYFNRPKSHYGSGKNAAVLKPSAPQYHITRPDTTKLIRPLEDALTGVLWRDDSQIVLQFAEKKFGEFPGAAVTVIRLIE